MKAKTTRCLLLALLVLAGPVEAAAARCEAAWAAYRELKARSLMDEAQYPLTAEGGEVRAACGRDALPAPPDADINPVRPRARENRPAGPPPAESPPPAATPPATLAPSPMAPGSGRIGAGEP